MRAEFHDVRSTAYGLKSSLTLKLVHHRHNVNGVLVHAEGLDGIINLLMSGLVECFWT